VCFACINSKDFFQSAVKKRKLDEQQHGFKRRWSHSLPTAIEWSPTRRLASGSSFRAPATLAPASSAQNNDRKRRHMPSPVETKHHPREMRLFMFLVMAVSGRRHLSP
jgi:hypothetical protein